MSNIHSTNIINHSNNKSKSTDGVLTGFDIPFLITCYQIINFTQVLYKIQCQLCRTWCESSMNISYREHDILVNIRLTAKSLPCEIQINTLYHYRYDILIIFVCRYTVGSRSIYRMSMLKSDAQTGSYAAAYIISGLPNFHDKTFHLVLGWM